MESDNLSKAAIVSASQYLERIFGDESFHTGVSRNELKKLLTEKIIYLMLHEMEIKERQDVRGGQGASRMARARHAQHLDDVAADF